MSLTLVEDNQNPNVNQLTQDLTSAVASSGTPAASQSNTKPSSLNTVLEGDDIPEKFRGKTVADALASYNNLESQYGRMANDLGEQRKLTDRFLNLEEKRVNDLSTNTPQVEITGAELLDNPMGALDKYIEAKLGNINEGSSDRINQIEAGLAETRFLTRHSDYTQLANDPGFQEWAVATPVRQRLANSAAQGNWQDADDLLTEFKLSQIKGQKQTEDNAGDTGQDTQAQLLNQAKQASLETSGDNGGTQAKGKEYRRIDLIELKRTNREKYEDPAFQAEIMKAYQEGRVK